MLTQDIYRVRTGEERVTSRINRQANRGDGNWTGEEWNMISGLGECGGESIVHIRTGIPSGMEYIPSNPTGIQKEKLFSQNRLYDVSIPVGLACVHELGRYRSFVSGYGTYGVVWWGVCQKTSVSVWHGSRRHLVKLTYRNDKFWPWRCCSKFRSFGFLRLRCFES